MGARSGVTQTHRLTLSAMATGCPPPRQERTQPIPEGGGSTGSKNARAGTHQSRAEVGMENTALGPLLPLRPSQSEAV